MWIYDCQINNNFFDPKKQLLQIRKEGTFHQWMMCKTEFDPTVTGSTSAVGSGHSAEPQGFDSSQNDRV